MVQLEEVKEVLQNFIKDKSLGLSIWTMELFFHFFDFVGQDLLRAIEESRKKEYILKNLNTTYITLIPKRDKLDSFDDFRPISLCNLVYNIITKIISNIIKTSLKNYISPE